MKSDDHTKQRITQGAKKYRQYAKYQNDSLVVKSPWTMLELCMSATRMPTSLATFMASSSTRVIFVLLLFVLLVPPVLPEGTSLGRLLGPSCLPILSLASCFSSSESRSGIKSASSSAEPLPALFSRCSRTVNPSMCSRYAGRGYSGGTSLVACVGMRRFVSISVVITSACRYKAGLAVHVEEKQRSSSSWLQLLAKQK